MAAITRAGRNRQKLPKDLRNRATKTDPTTAEWLLQAADTIHKQNNQIQNLQIHNNKLQQLVHHYENDYDYEEVDA